jgi:hypothetical protein
VSGGQNRFPLCVHYSTEVFKDHKWATSLLRRHRRPRIGHPPRPDPLRAGSPGRGQWYYKLQLGPLAHKIPPIISARWRRVTFIVTTGDRFMNVHEIYNIKLPQADLVTLSACQTNVGQVSQGDEVIGLKSHQNQSQHPLCPLTLSHFPVLIDLVTFVTTLS